MGTQIFLTACLGALIFMVYCLAHFVREGSSPRRQSNARQIAQDRRVLRFPQKGSAYGRSEEVRRRA